MSGKIMGTYKRLPVGFASGSGAWLTDTAGNRYLDALAGIAVCGLGHAHPAVARALSEQAATLVHTSNLYQVPLQEKLAGQLCELSGLDTAFFCNSGAEANEAAIKICRRYAHKRGITTPLIIVMKNGFHGRTLATLTATGNPNIKQGFEPLVEGFLHVPYNDPAAVERACNEHAGVAAVMLEPVQGEGGVLVPDPGYLKQITEICAARDVLLVIDEIQTGMCRTGRWFAFQHEGIRPDVVTLAKSLGNGVPVGACMATARAAEPMTPGSHGTTFGGNPLAASAALAVIDILREQRLDRRAASLGKRMLDEFREALDGVGGVLQVRGMGLMIGIELEKNCAEIVSMAMARGLLLNVTAERVVRLLPPLIITDGEATQIVSTTTAVIREFLGN